MRIEPAAGNSYAVSVQSPQGEGRETFQLPRIGEPSWAAARRTGETRDLITPLSTRLEAPALDVGKELFQALFRGEVANLFHASLGSLRGRHQGLRIDVSINPRRPELAPLQKLPWELLCRPETEDFLCLSRRTPVVRSLEAHRERRPAIARPRRLRILVVAASPADCASLAVARERANLEAAWKGQEKKVEIVFLERGGVEEMRQALLAAPFHILHFMGHGKFDEESSEGVLFFERLRRHRPALRGTAPGPVAPRFRVAASRRPQCLPYGEGRRDARVESVRRSGLFPGDGRCARRGGDDRARVGPRGRGLQPHVLSEAGRRRCHRSGGDRGASRDPARRSGGRCLGHTGPVPAQPGRDCSLLPARRSGLAVPLFWQALPWLSRSFVSFVSGWLRERRAIESDASSPMMESAF